jgi:hypothetical protein
MFSLTINICTQSVPVHVEDGAFVSFVVSMVENE